MAHHSPSAVTARTPACQDPVGVAVPADTGCDWQHVDPRFARCVSCPLPRCRYDYPAAEQSTAARLIQALRGQEQGATRPRSATAPPKTAQRQHGDPATVALPRDVLAHLAHQALVRGRARP